MLWLQTNQKMNKDLYRVVKILGLGERNGKDHEEKDKDKRRGKRLMSKVVVSEVVFWGAMQQSEEKLEGSLYFTLREQGNS